MTPHTRRMTIVVAVLALLAVPAMAGAVGGFNGPLFGLDTAPNGDILVADAGVGVHTVRNDAVVSTVSLPGAAAVSAVTNDAAWAVTGGLDPTADSGQGIHMIRGGHTRTIANLYAFEAAYDPDGAGVDSNPYDVASLGRHEALAVDAGGNTLLHVNRHGDIHVVAVFPDQLVSTDNIKALAQCPDPLPGFEFACDLPDAIPAQAVPTSVAIGPDGWYYVGELTGFPAPTDSSRVWKVAPWAHSATCPSAECVEVLSGFTSIIDLEFAKGKLLVAELDEDSWASVEFLQTGSGGTINACDVHRGSCRVVADGIPILTAITFGKSGLYATQNALIPGLAEVFKVR